MTAETMELIARTKASAAQKMCAYAVIKASEAIDRKDWTMFIQWMNAAQRAALEMC